MIEYNFQSVCPACGLVDPHYQTTALVGNYTILRKYDGKKHFQAVLNRLQGVWSKACLRFDNSYMEQLKVKLGNDHSLAHIHKHLPNRDQRYLNYIHSELTGKSLCIKMYHRQFLEHKFNRCYDEYKKLQGKRPCALNILWVIADSFPNLAYIKPFIYTKFTLRKHIYDRLKHACSNRFL